MGLGWGDSCRDTQRETLSWLHLTHPHPHLKKNQITIAEGLARALRAYPGAVVLASHDVRFVDEVLGNTCDGCDGGAGGGSIGIGGVNRPPPEIWVVGGMGVKRWAGGSASEYAERRLERLKARRSRA